MLLFPAKLLHILYLLVLSQNVCIAPCTLVLLPINFLPSIHLGKIDKSLTRFAKMCHLSEGLLPEVDLLVQMRGHGYE